MVVNRITTMGGRAGGGAGGGYQGYRSGLGSGRSYGLNNAQKNVLEAFKSDAAYHGNTVKLANGSMGYKIGGKTYSESQLASQIKSEWGTYKAKMKTTDIGLAKTLTFTAMSHKTKDVIPMSAIK